MRWTRKTIIQEIKRLHKEGVELNYSAAERNHLNLVRAAAWHYGTWRLAVEQAGIDYESLSRYQRWSRERIVRRIRELHKKGEDMSWRTISLETDPPLAAAALRSNGFASWREAIAAAGLDIEDTARYRYWDNDLVLKEIRKHHKKGESLSSKFMQENNQSLFCAARRRFGSWDKALDAAGLDATKIRLRRPKTTAKSKEEKPRTRRTRATAAQATAKSTRELAKSNGAPKGEASKIVVPSTPAKAANKAAAKSKSTAKKAKPAAIKTKSKPVTAKIVAKNSAKKTASSASATPKAKKAAKSTPAKTTGKKAASAKAKPAKAPANKTVSSRKKVAGKP